MKSVIRLVSRLAFTVCVTLLAPGLALAQTAGAATGTAQPAAENMSTGVVKKTDADQGKITISHGPLLNLDMPAMTMTFRVVEPAMVSKVKVGDNIKFVAGKVNGAFTVMRLELVGTNAVPAAATAKVVAPAVSPAQAARPSAVPPQAPVQVVATPAQSNAGNAGVNPNPPTARMLPAATPDDAMLKARPGDPADPAAVVPAPVYISAFNDYQLAPEPKETPDQVWRAANDEMARLGGHAGQIKDDGKDSANAMEQPQTGAPAKSLAAPSSHDMKNMSKEK